MKHFLTYWLPFYLYAGFIFYVSGISRPPLVRIEIPFFDKVLHIGEYAIFAILASRSFRNSSRKAFFENFKILAVLISIIYGISDEFHQAFIPERDCNFFDVLSDSIGGILGVFIYGRYYST